MELFESHRDAITAFMGRSVYDWTVVLNTWNTTRDFEYMGRKEDMGDKYRMAQPPRWPIKC